ncbi:hypothetical protein R3P38DRAFT_3366734 [Favolaschia claudopus]|uniref:Uncharacterized protein n=1 Tax=Favolaschia claudopus TaxID=2862362 RepID=A0AAW0ACD1_9AGAR
MVVEERERLGSKSALSAAVTKRHTVFTGSDSVSTYEPAPPQYNDITENPKALELRRKGSGPKAITGLAKFCKAIEKKHKNSSRKFRRPKGQRGSRIIENSDPLGEFIPVGHNSIPMSAFYSRSFDPELRWMGATLAAKVVSGKVVNTCWKSSLSTAKYVKLDRHKVDIKSENTVRTGNGAKNNAPIHDTESFRWRQKPRSRKSVQKTSGLWGKQLENETVNNYVSKNGAGICVLWAARFQGGAGDLSLRICISFGVQERRIPPTRVRIQIDQRSQREDRVADSCQHLVILGDTTSGLSMVES